jgi:NADH-quinone oxidoreductase subunit N
MDLKASLSYFTSEITLIIGLAVVLAVDLVIFRSSPHKRQISFGLTVATLLGAQLAMIPYFEVESPLNLFGGLLVLDQFSLFFRLIFLATILLVAVLSYFSKEIERKSDGEYFAMLLGLGLALFLLASSNNLLMVFLALEFVSVLSYILAGYKRSSTASTEAAIKYVIYGAVASGVMLFGFSFLYGATGHLGFAEIAAQLPQSKLFLSVVLGFVFVGFGYKIAAAPFHMWCPDVYEGAPTPVTALLSVGPKAAGFAVLIRFLYVIFAGSAVPMAALVGIVAAATMTLGNLVAIVQDNVKRMLAYSSIAHAGYLLMAVSTFTYEGVQALLLYATVYLVMNIGAFLVVIAVRNWTGREDIEAYNGLVRAKPLLAIAMALFLFSLVGLPPFGGFIGKFYIFAAVLQKGGFWYYALAVVGVLNSAISLYYYARVVKAMFLVEPTEDLYSQPEQPQRVLTLLGTALVIPILVIGIYWAPIQKLAARSTDLVTWAD